MGPWEAMGRCVGEAPLPKLEKNCCARGDVERVDEAETGDGDNLVARLERRGSLRSPIASIEANGRSARRSAPILVEFDPVG